MNQEFERLISFDLVVDTDLNRSNYLKIIKRERNKSALKPDLAVDYAANIIQGRFEQSEKIILKSPHWAMVYSADVLNKRWQEAEGIILKSNNISIQWFYFTNVVKTKWLEAEPILFRYTEIEKKYHEYLEWLENPQGNLFEHPSCL